jgi:serine/threonine-protein kinase RsbW
VTNATSQILRFRCSLDSIYSLREALRDLSGQSGLSAEACDDVVLAANEAATNAIRHGCSRGGEEITVRWSSDGECAEIEVEDPGVFKKRIPLPDLEGSHGRGIPLMIAVMDEVHIREGTPHHPGTVVRLVKCRRDASWTLRPR